MKYEIKQIPISDTNSTLFVRFIGAFNKEEKNRILPIIEKEIPHQGIFFNDSECKYWSFDYKSECGYWVENISYTDNMRKVSCTVCNIKH